MQQILIKAVAELSKVSTAFFLALLLASSGVGCAGSTASATGATSTLDYPVQKRLDAYETVELVPPLQGLSEKQRQMIPLLVEAADAMNEAFWVQAYGDARELLDGIEDPATRRFAVINYGPWDRLANNAPFVAGVGPKPLGANFYPLDMTKSELAEAAQGGTEKELLRSLYTMVRRNEGGELTAIPYSVFFAKQVEKAADKLRQAAELAEDAGLQRYLRLRADALLSDDYQESDIAWLDMRGNAIDIVIGPIETYEDQLFGYKAAFEAYVLLKDQQWSERLERYVRYLPDLQAALPVGDELKQEEPGLEAQLNAYDALYYAGDCNAGSKTIAINLPNDEEVQLAKGTRRLQLKNVMRAKFERILVPIASLLITEKQRSNVSFDAFFNNTMFHEVAHGLGIKHTLTGKGSVREALRDQASGLEEGKADVLGLFMVSWLSENADMQEVELLDNYVTFLAGIFRSIRFGSASAHGRANLVRFNFFREYGAFTRDARSGTYEVDFDKMQQAVTALSRRILELQGSGDYDEVVAFMNRYGVIDETLSADLSRLESANVPVDVVFKQGIEVLGL